VNFLKTYGQILVIALLFFLAPRDSFGAPPQAIEGNIDDVARAIQTYFPKLVGKVSAVDEDRLEIEIKAGQGLSEGVLLSVYREGEAFFHPVTGVLLGREEEELGTVEVIRFDPPLLTARRLQMGFRSEGPQEIIVGDGVRLPATRIPLAIAITSEGGEPFLMNELAAALSDTGRFRVDPLFPGAQFQEAFKRKNHYHIAIETAQVDGKFSMGLHIQNTLTGKSLASLAILIHQSEESDLILEHLQYQLFEQRQKK